MISIPTKEYPIWIGQDALSKLDYSAYHQVFVLVDENTQKHCLQQLPKISNAFVIVVKSGEQHKNISTCQHIWEALSKLHADRNSLLINLGGGVLADMGGFCAATYKRGIDFIQIPTTLLAMADAAVGGKVGIDCFGLKNQVGLFALPKQVLIFPEFLKTLPTNELYAGFAEIVKHALIADFALWKQILTTPFEQLIWQEIIAASVRIKNSIVLKDPTEQGERKKLNFGHTFGHAIESFYLKKGNPILHGEAVLMGILLESELSVLQREEKQEIKQYILSCFALPYTPNLADLKELLQNDKKNKNGKINFSLLNGIGNCTFDNLFTIDEL